MTPIATPPDRRRFLRLAAGFSAGAMLAGCGGAGREDDVATPLPAATSAPVVVAGSHALNLALTLGYVGAQFYGHAARGSGLAASETSGIGTAGAVTGARAASFADPVIARHAAELADDKRAHVVALRARIGSLTAAQPAIDLSTGPGSAFASAAQGAGIVTGGGSFDPYADDDAFLLGALLIENAVAAAYRTLLVQDTEVADVVAGHLADSIYHGGLIRTLLDDRAAGDSAIDRAVGKATALMAAIDGTDTGDQSLAGASGVSSNLFDAEGRAIPFTRGTGQILKGLYLSTGGPGGFLPNGANGIAAS